MPETTPPAGAIDDSAAKPRFKTEPRAYLRRQLRLKLNDLLGRVGLRVFDRIDMTSARTATKFNHIIDVGVAFGTPDLYELGPNAQIELFEPQPQFHDLLERGIMRQRKCRLHKIAIGAANGEATFHLSGPASASLLGTLDKPGRTFPTMLVPVRRLDDVLKPADLIRPAILKIDTEGYELAVLEGAEGLLPSIDAVILEMHLGKAYAYRPQQILDIMARHGFALIDILDREVRNARTTCCDMVFERPAKADNL
ncbi:MAG: FkbM family methyltransferase [Hyphomicrobiaceae bacterium]